MGETILERYQKLPYFGDAPLDRQIDGMHRLSSNEELSDLTKSDAKYFVVFTIRPQHGFYVIERIEVQNNLNTKE
jgi:hypothetical protein